MLQILSKQLQPFILNNNKVECFFSNPTHFWSFNITMTMLKLKKNVTNKFEFESYI